VAIKLKRRRCKNCDELFERTTYQSVTKKFCSTVCQKEFNRHRFPRKLISRLVVAEVQRELKGLEFVSESRVRELIEVEVKIHEAVEHGYNH